MSRLETRYSWDPAGPWSEWTRTGFGDGAEPLYVESAPYRHPNERADYHFRWCQDRYVPDDVIAPGLPRDWGWRPCSEPVAAESCRAP